MWSLSCAVLTHQLCIAFHHSPQTPRHLIRVKSKSISAVTQCRADLIGMHCLTLLCSNCYTSTQKLTMRCHLWGKILLSVLFPCNAVIAVAIPNICRMPPSLRFRDFLDSAAAVERCSAINLFHNISFWHSDWSANAIECTRTVSGAAVAADWLPADKNLPNQTWAEIFWRTYTRVVGQVSFFFSNKHRAKMWEKGSHPARW